MKYSYVTYRKQKGLGIASALFFIVVISLLLASLANLLRSDDAAFSQEVLSLRAFLAAESGAQLAANRLLPPNGVSSCGITNYTFTRSGLLGCQADVTCIATTVASNNYYTITSTGNCSSGDLSASREIQIRALP